MATSRYSARVVPSPARDLRIPNTANVLVVLGLATLTGTFLVPSLTARRVARVEARAQEVAQALFDEALGHAPLDLGQADQLASELAPGLRARCLELGQPEGDLPEPIPGQRVPTFGNRHYLFRIVREPAPLRRPPDWDPERRRPLEVYAWPRTLLPPGRTVFVVPEHGPIAYTRNLSAGFRGLRRMPAGGAGTPRTSLDEAQQRGSFRSSNDERWILLEPDRPPMRR